MYSIKKQRFTLLGLHTHVVYLVHSIFDSCDIGAALGQLKQYTEAIQPWVSVNSD